MLICSEATASREAGPIKWSYSAESSISVRRAGRRYPLSGTVLLLALESSEVIGLRIAKLARGDADAQREPHLIVSERMMR
jgi:hypothetical protein